MLYQKSLCCQDSFVKIEFRIGSTKAPQHHLAFQNTASSSCTSRYSAKASIYIKSRLAKYPFTSRVQKQSPD